MEAIEWSVARAAFDWDGSLRDIYVLATDEGDWQRMLRWLATSAYPVQFTIGDQPHPLPNTGVADIVSSWSETSVLLRVDPDRLGLNRHFFCVEQIEFDPDPRDISTADQFSDLLNFMRGVGDAVGKEVILTPENGEQYPLLRYSPLTRAWVWCEEAER